jgi:hypothetical protein
MTDSIWRLRQRQYSAERHEPRDRGNKDREADLQRVRDRIYRVDE